MKQKNSITRELVDIQVNKATLNKNMNGELMQCFIIRHMTPKKPPIWFQTYMYDFEARNNARFDRIEKRLDQNGLKPLVE